MAFTKSFLVNTVFGDKRVKGLRLTADGAEATVDAGLSVIDHMDVSFQSAATAWRGTFKMNLGSTSTALNGFIGISGVTSGDVIFVTVYGR